MGLLVRRLWRTLGWYGAVGLSFSIFILLLLGTGNLTWDSRLLEILRPVLLLLLGLGIAAATWGSYQKSVETSPYPEVLRPLLASREEFCLLLRPFGSDGEVLVPHIRGVPGKFGVGAAGSVTPTKTLEQVVAEAARNRLGMASYAMVDQNQLLAPPGPIYLRSPHSEWKKPAAALIRRAHTIAILLPPAEDLRAALEWELGEIIRMRRQSRVLIVLPPHDRRQYQPEKMRRQAGLLLAALEGDPTTIQQVPKARIEHYLADLPADLLLVKVLPDGGFLSWYSVPGRRWSKVATSTYRELLDEALDANEKEFAGLGFAARYGRPNPR